MGRAFADWKRIIRLLRKRHPQTVICEAAVGFPVFWLLVLVRPWLGYRLIAWGHGIDNRDWAQKTFGWRFRLLALALRFVDGMILYSSARATELAHRLPWLDITVAPNSLDTEELCRHGRELDQTTTDTADQTFRMVFLGRLIRGKKLELAFHALLGWEFQDWEFRIIGDGPDGESLTRLANRDPRIRFLGEIQDNHVIGQELHRADLMLHPGNLGLVVLHSYAYACPILTCENGSCGIEHGPESELLDEANSLCCPAHPQSIRMVLRRVESNREHLRTLGTNGRALVESTRGLGPMIKGFSRATAIAARTAGTPGVRTRQ